MSKSNAAEERDVARSDEPVSEVKRATHSAPSIAASYQDLDGGFGREVYFRPPRYPSAEFGPVGATVVVTSDDWERDCDLHDVSQNGVAFEWTGSARLHVGDLIPVLAVSFDGHEAYRGAARVGSVREVGVKQIVGASFLDTLMNIDDVLHLRDVKVWQGAGSGLGLRDRPWRSAAGDVFKARIAELRLLLEDAEEQLGHLEASLPWHVAHGDHASPARAALVERIRQDIAKEIVLASNAINDAYLVTPASDRPALKEYSHRLLHKTLMQAPWMRQALEKPLGYPGDYQLMNGLYGNHFSGNTLFAKALNLGFVSTPAGAAVRARKDLIKQRLSLLLDSSSDEHRPLRILSIAAGPAQEIYELLDEREHLPRPLEVVLFDQDKGALAFSYARLKRVVSTRYPKSVKVIYLHDSIKRLLRDETIFNGFGQFDAIFSCGLFDYLQAPTAASLARTFYENVAPGGTVYIGNMTPDNPSRWFMELHLEWSLIYRERAQLEAFAAKGAPTAKIAILEEATGVNPFVTLTRG